MDYLRLLHQSFVGFLNQLAKQDEAAGRKPMCFSRAGYAGALRGTTTGRYVVLRADVGHDNERLMSELSQAVLYQLIPWDTGKLVPQVYLDRRWVALEAPLPQEAQNANITLASLTEARHGGQILILGPNEYGTTISLPLRDVIHVLIGGETGAGKTYTMRSLVYQLANGRNRIVLIDGKHGDGLGILQGIPGQVGPLATQTQDVRAALAWVRNEMLERYEAVLQRGGKAWKPGEGPPHLCVFFDEFQEYRKDSAVTTLLQKLAAQGRAARVHLFAGTQKPTVNMFGSDEGGATRDQFGTRIAHTVNTFQASNAIIGGPTPRADYLQPKGDAYILGSSDAGPICERVQIAYVPEETLETFCKGTPDMDRWPEFDASTLDGTSTTAGRPAIEFSNDQLAASVFAAKNGWGRGRLADLLNGLDAPIAGTDPLRRLLEQGKEINATLRDINRSEQARLLVAD